MPDPVPSDPGSPARRRPVCTIASWIVPAAGGLLTFMAYQIAVVRRSNGDWLPGMGELLIGIFITALGAFGCGLAALLRRERNSWLALMPGLCGLGVILYFGWNLLRNTIVSH